MMNTPIHDLERVRPVARSGSRHPVLRRVPFFSRLSDQQLDRLGEHCATKVFRDGTLVICEGDQTDSMYVIVAGSVRVFLGDDRGKEVTLANLGPFDYFGELAPLDESPRSASVVTTSRTTCLVIAKQDLQRCLADDPQLYLDVVRTLTSRVRALNERTRSLALKDVSGRVWSVLLDMAEEAPEAGLVVCPRPTHQELANLVGASREMVCRVLKDMASSGRLRMEAERIVLPATRRP